VEFLVCFKYRILLFAKNDKFISSFPILSILVLSKDYKEWIPCLIPNFRENAFSFHQLENVGFRFVKYSLKHVEVCSFCS
jgi:hypothetical protein